MGIYLNNETAYMLYKNETEKPYFVDKSLMLEELFSLVQEGTSYICITRPRRFGKTVMANMIASFFLKTVDSSDIFDTLNISRTEKYSTFLNHYPVIHISFNDISRKCISYEQYISRIEDRLIQDLKREYPYAVSEPIDSVSDLLLAILAEDKSAQFVFVLDEWDFLFHQPFVKESEKEDYLSFLRNLLKDRPYVRLAYMTGILPISKYSSGSELNMFTEFTMASRTFSDYFGFLQEEVDVLFENYLKNCKDPLITRDGLESWYNGYHTASGKQVYNPRSVVQSLRFNELSSYWTASGPYDEIYYYIENNVAEVRDDLARMISGFPVPVKIREYAATSMNLRTKDEIFSAMVVYGFLSYDNGKVSIPNKELMDRFSEMLQKEAHDTESPLLQYNNETELTVVVNLVYLAARDQYRVEREEKSGIGYVDFIFYPETDRNADCIILELKVDHTPEEAVEQIRNKRYDLRFRGKIGENKGYTGRILAVGIGYDKKSKRHRCKVEIL